MNTITSKKWRCSLFWLPLLILQGCVALEPKVERSVASAPLLKMQFYRGVGRAVIDVQSGHSRLERKQNAEHVARLHAYRDLANQLYAVLLSAETRVTDAQIDRDQVKLKVQGYISGAKVQSVQEQAGQVEVVLELRVN